MLRSLKLQKKIVALWSLFSLVLNMAQPAFVALTLAPVIVPSSVQAEDVVADPTPAPVEPTIAPSTEPSIAPSVEPTATPVESIAPSAEPSVEPSVSPEPSPDATLEPGASVEPSTEPSVSSAPAPADTPANPEPGQDSSPAPPASVEPSPSASPTPTPNLNEQLNIAIVDNTAAQSIQEFDLTVSEPGSATLQSDKADYAPTDTAIITGSGFLANTTYRLTVSSTDEPATSTTVDVTTDSDGTLFYAYQLDGTYRPNYLVEAYLGSTLVTTITFTDGKPEDPGNPAADLDQCKNETATTPQSPCQWVNGSLNANQAHYVEGQSVPYRLRMTNLTNGVHTVTLGYDVKHSGAHALDFLTHYNRLEPHSPFGHLAEVIDPTSGVVGLGSPNTFAIPAPSSVGSPVAGQPTTLFNSLPAGEKLMTIYNGSITGITYPVEGSLTDAQSETQIQVTFTSTDPTVVLAWGGHIGMEATWGTNNSAGGISGAPYHMRLKDLDGAGGNQDRSLQAGAVAPPSSIRIIKDAQPNHAQDFSFVTTGNGLTNFSLDDDADGTLSNTTTFNSLLAGTFTVTENATTGWALDSVNCVTDGTSNTTSQFTPITNGMSINLVAGENVTCTFTNSINNGDIIVKKVMVGGTDTFAFTGDVAGSITTNNGTLTTANISAGTYTSTETPVSGWELTDITCDDANSTGNLVSGLATFNVEPGETVMCTFTNTKKGHLVVDKVTVPSGSLQSFDFVATGSGYTNFSLTDAATPNDQELSPGTYSISETVPTGWDLTSSPCVSSLQDTETTASLELDAGETITCTFTNTQRGRIYVTKQTLPDGDPAIFDFTASYDADGFTLSDGQTNDSGYLVPGSYTVAELAETGWDPTSSSCDDGSPVSSISLQAGETINCTFTNTKFGSISGFKWEDMDGDGIWDAGEPAASGWLISLLDDQDNVLGTDTTDVNGFYSFNNLLPATYSLIENLLTGWTQTSAPADVVLSAGEESADNNFGNFENISITVCKAADADGLLTTTDDRTPVSGWAIDLSKNGNVIDDTRVTGRTGCYTWSNLGPGDYSTSEETQTGWTNLDSTTHNFGTVQSGSTYSHTFVNTQYGSIIVEKQTDPDGDPTLFEFDTSYSSNFSLSDGQQNNSGYLLPGTYSVAELTPAGWDITSAICSDQSNTASISLAAGETVTCVFTNQADSGIVIVKQTDPDGDTTVFDFDLSYGSSDADLSDGQSASSGDLDPGTYSVSENTPVGWDLLDTTCVSSIGDTESAASLELDAGETITCTFTNQKDSSIIVIKQTIPDGSQENFEFDSNYHNDNFLLTDGYSDLSGDLAPGTYSVVELPEAGWDLTSATCDDGSDPSSISLQSGEDVTCTFTNTQRGHIIVDKVTDPSGDAQSFNFDATGGLYQDFSLDDNDTPNDQTLVPGTYGVTENAIAGWTLTDTTCVSSLRDVETASSLELDPGETITCTFTNTALGNITVIKYNDHNGNGLKDDGDEVLGDTGVGAEVEATRWEMHLVGTGVNAYQWTGAGDPAVAGQVTFSDLMPNSFTLSEQIKAGWVQTNISCGLQGEVYDAESDNLSFALSAGQDLTCYVGNQGRGTVTVNKNVDTDNDGQVDIFGSTDWLFELATADYTMGTTVPVAAGSYLLDEFQNSGYHFVSLFCDDVNQNSSTTTVNVGPGDAVVCTYTNARDTGTIIVHKIIDPDGIIEGEGATDDQFPGENWTVDVDGESEDTSDPTSQPTNDVGSSTFSNLKTGTYNALETQQPGYELIDAYCDDDNGSPDGETIYSIDLGKDETINCTFINSPNGVLHGRKWNDVDGQGDFDELELLSGWTINLYKDNGEGYDFIDSMVTDNGTHYGWYWFEHLFPGDYKICEVGQPGYQQTYPAINDGCYLVSLPSGTSSPSVNQEVLNFVAGPAYDFGNAPLTDIHGYKWDDINGNGQRDCGLLEELTLTRRLIRECSTPEDLLGGWTIFLDENDNEILDEGEESTTTDNDPESQHYGWYQFYDLFPGEYTICEVQQDGWQQTYPLGRETVCHHIVVPNDNEQTENGTVGPEYHFGNQAEPVLRIQKSNDAVGNKNPGDIVTYTLVVDLTGSALAGVKVTDVTPDGFTYVAGSWTADLNGSPLIVTEPDYASPGTWLLGDMVDGDVITLTYQAKISADQDGGTYNDIAWAEGSSKGWGTVLALGHDSEYVDEIFVGTDVVINKVVPQTGSVDIEGEVLGAATELPATGPNTGWLYLALSLLITGLALILGGRRMRYLTIVLISAFSFLIVAPTTMAAAPSLSIRVEQPQSPTRLNEWKLSYAVLDRLARTPSIACYVKKPGSGSFVQFDVTKTATKSTGDNGSCQVNSSVMSSGQGAYEFYVTASAAGPDESRNSATVSVVYDTEGPDRPVSYSKEHPWACRYTIKFKTADDGGKTAWVEVFGSKSTSFNTDNGTRIGSVGIGSNQEGSLNHDLVGDDCNQTWYYVIRAFDASGNQSAHLGDEVVTVTSGSPAPTTAALVVTAAGRGGSVLGSDQADGDKGEVLGESGDGEEQAESVEGDGLVAGATRAAQSLAQNKSFWWIVLVIIALRIVYGILRKKIQK